jgi:hypothetical protein
LDLSCRIGCGDIWRRKWERSEQRRASTISACAPGPDYEEESVVVVIAVPVVVAVVVVAAVVIVVVVQLINTLQISLDLLHFPLHLYYLVFPSVCLAILFTENPAVITFACDNHFELADRAGRDGAQ